MISVIITTCCRPINVIERAVNSVFHQTYKDWELIVVDDSPDTFEDRIKVEKYFQSLKTSQSVTYIQNDMNMGACYSRNRGLEVADGEFVAYLDDDDEWLPEKLMLQYKAMQDHSDQIAMVYCPCILIDQRYGKEKICARKLTSGFLLNELLINGNFVGGTSNPLIRTSCLRNIRGFDVEMQSWQDYDVWLRLAERYEISYVSQPLINYYLYNGEQITTNHKKQIQGGERIIEKNKNYLSKCRKALGSRYRLLVPHYAAEKMYRKAFKAWMIGSVNRPFDVEYNCKGLYSIIRNIYLNCKRDYEKSIQNKKSKA